MFIWALDLGYNNSIVNSRKHVSRLFKEEVEIEAFVMKDGCHKLIITRGKGDLT